MGVMGVITLNKLRQPKYLRHKPASLHRPKAPTSKGQKDEIHSKFSEQFQYAEHAAEHADRFAKTATGLTLPYATQ
jgi:hypothetical protein